MSIDNNKMQVDIENLFKQNVNDLSAIKELYRKLKEMEEKITQIKYIDSALAKKLKKEYENLKRIILDENVTLYLDKKIEVNTKLINDINEAISHFNLQLDNIKSNVKENYAKKSEIGTPLTAALKSQMTDTSKVYVYTGSEDGMTNGNWYSHNGNEWVSGGVYNSSAVSTTNKSYLINSKAEIVSDNKYVQGEGTLTTLTNSAFIKFDCYGITKIAYGRTRAFVQGEGVGYYDSQMNKIGYEKDFEVIKTVSGYTYYLLDLSKYQNVKYIITTRRYGDLWQVDYKFYNYYEFYSDGAYEISSKNIIDNEVRERVKSIYTNVEEIKPNYISKKTDILSKDYSLKGNGNVVSNNQYIKQTGDIVTNENSSYLKISCGGLSKVIYARTKQFVEGEGVGYYNEDLAKVGYETSFNLIKTENGYYYYLFDLTNYPGTKYILTTKQYSTLWAIDFKIYDYYNFYETESISTLLNCSLADIELRKKVKNIEEELNGSIVNHILKDKKWTIIGDSLSDETNVLPNRKYSTMIKELTGVNVQNLAHAGFGWKNGDNYFVEIAKSIATDSDILTFMGSINDKDYTLGTATDKTTDTIGGCINLAIDNAYNKNLGIKIGLISPIPSGSTNIPSNTDCFLHKLTVLMEEVANLRGVPFLDLFHSSNIRTNNTSFVSSYMLDDTHLNELGQEKFMVNRILSFITSI